MHGSIFLYQVSSVSSALQNVARASSYLPLHAPAFTLLCQIAISPSKEVWQCLQSFSDPPEVPL